MTNKWTRFNARRILFIWIIYIPITSTNIVFGFLRKLQHLENNSLIHEVERMRKVCN